MPNETFPVGARVQFDHPAQSDRHPGGRIESVNARGMVGVRWDDPEAGEHWCKTRWLKRLPDDALTIHAYVGRVIRQCMEAGITDYSITIQGRIVPIAHIVYMSSDGRTYRQRITEDSAVTP